jgi:hypothetical protein
MRKKEKGDIRMYIAHIYVFNEQTYHICCYVHTSGFWPRLRVRALRAPIFLGSLPRQRGAARHRSFAASPKIKNTPETKCFPSAPNLDRQGRISFHWAKLHPSELPPAPS